MTINNNNKHAHIVALNVQSTSAAIFAASSPPFFFAINIMHDIIHPYSLD